MEDLAASATSGPPPRWEGIAEELRHATGERRWRRWDPIWGWLRVLSAVDRGRSTFGREL
ncbi:MAG: hypothetical protein M1826_007440 [Phylliscum demangeonii]|nr:MAG: hypothetical protein M1826_007440 [Phylliscum demangeonii]